MSIDKRIEQSKLRKFLEKKVGPIRFSRMLKSRRLGEELSQTEFAKLLGISKSHLNDIEKGRKFVSPERAARFATILGFSPERYIKLALEEQLAKAGLKYTVELKRVS